MPHRWRRCLMVVQGFGCGLLVMLKEETKEKEIRFRSSPPHPSFLSITGGETVGIKGGKVVKTGYRDSLELNLF